MLKIKRHIVRTNWMLAPETLQLFEVLQDKALFVGGAVRNILLEVEVDDIDIATVIEPDKVVELLQNAGIRVIPTGIDHGTVTAIIGDYSYEITTLRRDVDTDGRRALVEYTQCWLEDAKRRDFTMNALFMDLKGNIYDPLGSGLADLDVRCVRFVGEPEQRIKEDYLRVLRFFRFSAIYGGGDFDVAGLSACKKNSYNIKNLSRERISQEFFKIIVSDKPYNVLNIMFEHNVLSEFNFTNDNLKFFQYFCNFQSRYGLNALSSRVFVMAGMDLKNIKKMEKLVLFPKVFLKDMKAINGALNLSDLNCDHAVRECVYRFGRVITAQCLMIELGQDRVMNSYAPKALDIIQNWDIPNFPISGNDLIAKGMSAGKELGEELTRLENEWIDSGFKTTI